MYIGTRSALDSNHKLLLFVKEQHFQRRCWNTSPVLTFLFMRPMANQKRQDSYVPTFLSDTVNPVQPARYVQSLIHSNLSGNIFCYKSGCSRYLNNIQITFTQKEYHIIFRRCRGSRCRLISQPMETQFVHRWWMVSLAR